MSNVPSQCLSWSWHLECMELERKAGYAAALDAAQEAIAALDKVGQGQDYVLGVFDSLSAIETLKHNTSP